MRSVRHPLTVTLITRFAHPSPTTLHLPDHSLHRFHSSLTSFLVARSSARVPTQTTPANLTTTKSARHLSINFRHRLLLTTGTCLTAFTPQHPSPLSPFVTPHTPPTPVTHHLASPFSSDATPTLFRLENKPLPVPYPSSIHRS